MASTPRSSTRKTINKLPPFLQRVCDEVHKKHPAVVLAQLSQGKGWIERAQYTAECIVCGKAWIMTEAELREFIKKYNRTAEIIRRPNYGFE